MRSRAQDKAGIHWVPSEDAIQTVAISVCEWSSCVIEWSHCWQWLKKVRCVGMSPQKTELGKTGTC